MDETNELELWCYIEGGLRPFSVRVLKTANVDNLREVISARIRNAQKSDLILLKPVGDIPVVPTKTLAARLTEFVSTPEELDLALPVSSYFPNANVPSPLAKLHVIVRRPVLESQQNQPAGPTILGLRRFRSAVWGKRDALKKEIVLGGRNITVPYLDLGPYVHDLQKVWSQLEERVLIRREYILALEYIRENSGNMRLGGLVVTGQPGIGKTMFLFYLLVQQLGDGKPVALQVKADGYYLFTETTVELHGADDAEALYKYGRIWGLSNSSDDVGQPASGFRTAPETYTIQASALHSKHWRQWCKERNGMAYVMDIWPDDELHALGIVLGYTGPDLSRLLELFKRWGASPRTAIRIMRDPARDGYYSALASSGASRLAREPNEIFIKFAELDMECDTSSVLFVRTGQEEDGSLTHLGHTVWIPSKHILLLIASHLQVASASQQAQFFARMSGYPSGPFGVHPSTHSAVEWLFRAWVYTRFTHSPLECIWRKANPALPSSFPAVNPAHTISDIESLEARTPFYWQPPNTNSSGIDGVVCDGAAIYCLKASAGSVHVAAETGMASFKEMLPPAFEGLPWRLVFVSPERAKLESLVRSVQLDGDWKDMDVGGCVINLTSGMKLITPDDNIDFFFRI